MVKTVKVEMLDTACYFAQSSVMNSDHSTAIDYNTSRLYREVWTDIQTDRD